MQSKPPRANSVADTTTPSAGRHTDGFGGGSLRDGAQNHVRVGRRGQIPPIARSMRDPCVIESPS